MKAPVDCMILFYALGTALIHSVSSIVDAFPPPTSSAIVGIIGHQYANPVFGLICGQQPSSTASPLSSSSMFVAQILRGGAEKNVAKTQLSMLKNSVMEKTWKFRDQIWLWISTLCHIMRKELQAFNTNQRWIVAGIFMLGLQLGRLLSRLRLGRLKDAADIPSHYFGPSAPLLRGRVASVSDGDTIRLYHTPTIFHNSRFDRKTMKLSEDTLPIRLCTIDAPETAKFGKSGQAFGKEAKEKMESLVGDKMIQIRMLTRDQYGRGVAQVFVPRSLPFLPRQGVDEVMLQAGLAEVYQGMGAVYGSKGKDFYLELEASARKAKVGIWSQGKKRESAAEYKKRTK